MNRFRITGILCIIPLAWAVQTAGQDRYQLADLKELEQAFVRFAEDYRPCVVAIRTYDPISREPRNRDAPRGLRIRDSHGTGFVIAPDGLILTNHHVVRGAGHIIVILHDGRECDAQLRAADARSDLAVLKIDQDHLKAVRLGDATQLRTGQWALAVGNPFGMASVTGQSSVTIGTISGLGRDMTGELASGRGINGSYYGNLIETSAAVNPGNSGGPLFTLAGEVVGVVTAIESRTGVNQGVGFAIPIDRYSRRLIDALTEGREFHYGYLGIQPPGERYPQPRAVPLGFPVEGEGAVIGEVVADQPAAHADLRELDRIVSFNGERVKNWDQLIRVVGFTAPGTRAEIKFFRGGELRSATVEIGDRAEGTKRAVERRE